MTWAPTKTQQAIFDVLSADADLQALLGANTTTPKVFDFVPDNTVFPYVTLQIKPWVDRGNHDYEGLSAMLTIHVWDQNSGGKRGDLFVQSIQKRIDELLHNTEPNIDGWGVVVFRRNFIDIVTDPDNVTKHGIQRFKLYIGSV